MLRLLVGGAIVVLAALASLLSRPADAPAPLPSPTGAAGVVAVPPRDPIAWQDVRWVAVPDAGQSLGGPLAQRIDRIVAGGPGYVAAGVDARGQVGAETPFAAIWLSANGETWVEGELNAGVRPGETASIGSLAAGPRGVIAWGGVCCAVETAVAWWSPDGARWERVPLPAGFEDLAETYVTDLAAGPEGFVAVGASGRLMAIWTSPDGRAWSAIDPEKSGLEAGLFTSVARDDRGWLAVGQFNRATHDGAIWRSDDLVSWRKVADAAPLAGPEEVELWDVQAYAGGYLLLGSLGSHEERVACEQLLGRGDGRLASAGGKLALSCGWGVQTHWWSADGDTWQLLPPIAEKPGGPPLPVRPDGRGLMERGPIRAGGPGLVTIGYDVAGRDGPFDVRGVWVTADARTWEPVGQPAQFAPTDTVTDIVVSGRRVIAVGSWWEQDAPNGEDAKVWIGTVLP